MQASSLTIEDGIKQSKKELPLILSKYSLFLLILSFGLIFVSFHSVQYLRSRDELWYRRRSHEEEKIQEKEELLPRLDDWIRPPSQLMHNMTDEELSWRATFVPRRPNYPFRRIPKVAFLFLTRGTLPLAPLWEKFFEGHQGLFTIYVHSLPIYHTNISSNSVFFQRQIPSKETKWGEISMIDAERRLLANALLDISNERFILLSEACIPVHGFTTVYDYLTKSRHSFVSILDDPGPGGRGRYSWNMLPEVDLSQWRKSSQWFEVSREVALLMVEDITYYPKFHEFCKPDCYSDEHYFATMLSIKAPTLLANRSLTWVDWSRGGAHPATFGGNDITEFLLGRIYKGQICTYNFGLTNKCVLFARKFAPSALGPLMEKLAPKF